MAIDYTVKNAWVPLATISSTAESRIIEKSFNRVLPPFFEYANIKIHLYKMTFMIVFRSSIERRKVGQHEKALGAATRMCPQQINADQYNRYEACTGSSRR